MPERIYKEINISWDDIRKCWSQETVWETGYSIEDCDHLDSNDRISEQAIVDIGFELGINIPIDNVVVECSTYAFWEKPEDSSEQGLY